jgi:hypothetical protein
MSQKFKPLPTPSLCDKSAQEGRLLDFSAGKMPRMDAAHWARFEAAARNPNFRRFYPTIDPDMPPRGARVAVLPALSNMSRVHGLKAVLTRENEKFAFPRPTIQWRFEPDSTPRRGLSYAASYDAAWKLTRRSETKKVVE